MSVFNNDVLLEKYSQLGFSLVAISGKTKQPVSFARWSSKDYELSRDYLLNHLENNGNLAVNCGKSIPKLVVLDYDSQEINPELLDFTLTEFTPRGIAFFTIGSYDSKLYKPLKEKFPQLDTARRGSMYQLIPPSSTCSNHSKKCIPKTQCDYKMRVWKDISKPIISFREFAQLALKGGLEH